MIQAAAPAAAGTTAAGANGSGMAPPGSGGSYVGAAGSDHDRTVGVLGLLGDVVGDDAGGRGLGGCTALRQVLGFWVLGFGVCQRVQTASGCVDRFVDGRIVGGL